MFGKGMTLCVIHCVDTDLTLEYEPTIDNNCEVEQFLRIVIPLILTIPSISLSNAVYSSFPIDVS